MSRGWAVLALAAALALAAFAADPEEPPKDVGLIERASTRLAQLDVTVSGPDDAIEGLTAADFMVKINGVPVEKIFVDDLCLIPLDQPAVDSKESPAVVPATASEPPKANVATYILFFDMPHLTMAGRRGSIDAAQEMLPKLLEGGNQAMIVVNASSLQTIVPMTTDVPKLQAALAKLVNDTSTFDTYASLEENRMADIIHEQDRSQHFAMSLAQRFAAEERWKQERDLRRLSMVLGRLADFDAPKSVLYFADIMRQNAGEHYLAFFPSVETLDANGKPTSDAAAIQMDAATGALPLDKVIDEASGLGIRLYTIEGQGLTVSSFAQWGGGSTERPVALKAAVSPALRFQRTRDAQTTLASLASETGGRSFINGVTPSKMAAQILRDLSCMYLLSFDAEQFHPDEPLRVSVKVKRPGVTVSARGRLVIQSEATRVTARVLSAFATAASSPTDSAAVSVGLIPIAYKNGNFKARVQVALAGSALPSTTWDIGASVVSKGVVWQDGSGRIQVSAPHTPVIYEKDMEFAPGDYDLVAVAREVQTDTLASKEVHGSWPKLDAELACLGPIAVSQPLAGGFLRNGQSRTQGAVLVAEDGMLRPDFPTAVIVLVCRAKDQKRPLTAVRTLIGEDSTPVGTTKLDLSTDRCGQVVDLIPAKMLGAGRYQYIISVSSDGNELARGERTLIVPEKPPAPVKSSS